MRPILAGVNDCLLGGLYHTRVSALGGVSEGVGIERSLGIVSEDYCLPVKLVS